MLLLFLIRWQSNLYVTKLICLPYLYHFSRFFLVLFCSCFTPIFIFCWNHTQTSCHSHYSTFSDVVDLMLSFDYEFYFSVVFLLLLFLWLQLLNEYLHMVWIIIHKNCIIGICAYVRYIYEYVQNSHNITLWSDVRVCVRESVCAAAVRYCRIPMIAYAYMFVWTHTQTHHWFVCMYRILWVYICDSGHLYASINFPRYFTFFHLAPNYLFR